MAISLTINDVKEKYIPKYWSSFGEFENYYLQSIRETRADTIYYTGKSGVEEKLPPINHFPELKEYEIWEEGYAATGESGTAHLVGKVMARNFGQACHIVMCKSF